MPNRIEGTIKLNIRANSIQPFSISLLNLPDTIPSIPTTREVTTAHCQEKTRYKAKKPIEITKIVDFEESFFIPFL